ncbi:MEDS domain-containing protein [Candidatus Woesearchaeota archaeon]|nr:MEDS domain-containing protein [Candidatus Woesearchaeota archaeon]
MLLLYKDREEMIEAFASYFSQGLKDQEMCMFSYDDEEIIKRLKSAMAKYVDVESFESEGQIVFMEKDSIYFENNEFDQEKVYETLKERLSRRQILGPGIRSGGDISWLGDDLFSQFAEYEQGLTERFSNDNLIIMCAYPLSQLSPEKMVFIMQAHPFVIEKNGELWVVKESEQELADLG